MVVHKIAHFVRRPFRARKPGSGAPSESALTPTPEPPSSTGLAFHRPRGDPDRRRVGRSPTLKATEAPPAPIVSPLPT